MGIENSVVERAYKAYKILCTGGNLQKLGVSEELTEAYSNIVSFVEGIAADLIYSDLTTDDLLNRVSAKMEEFGNNDGYESGANESDQSKEVSVNPTNTEEDTLVTAEVSNSIPCDDSRSGKTNRRFVSFLLHDTELRSSQMDIEINKCSPIRELNITAFLGEPESRDSSASVANEPRSVSNAVFITLDD